LRVQPEINNSYNNLPEDEIIDGNTAAIFPIDSRGFAIAEETDDTGRVWWFVIMENNESLIKSNLYPGNNKVMGYRTLGWMSSRYVRKLN
jgi:hypothetical protein